MGWYAGASPVLKSSRAWENNGTDGFISRGISNLPHSWDLYRSMIASTRVIRRTRKYMLRTLFQAQQNSFPVDQCTADMSPVIAAAHLVAPALRRGLKAPLPMLMAPTAAA